MTVNDPTVTLLFHTTQRETVAKLLVINRSFFFYGHKSVTNHKHLKKKNNDDNSSNLKDCELKFSETVFVHTQCQQHLKKEQIQIWKHGSISDSCTVYALICMYTVKMTQMAFTWEYGPKSPRTVSSSLLNQVKRVQPVLMKRPWETGCWVIPVQDYKETICVWTNKENKRIILVGFSQRAFSHILTHFIQCVVSVVLQFSGFLPSWFWLPFPCWAVWFLPTV